jgi:hypothetical protein
MEFDKIGPRSMTVRTTISELKLFRISRLQKGVNAKYSFSYKIYFCC